MELIRESCRNVWVPRKSQKTLCNCISNTHTHTKETKATIVEASTWSDHEMVEFKFRLNFIITTTKYRKTKNIITVSELKKKKERAT